MNEELLNLLKSKLEEKPNLRFIQALWELKIIDSDGYEIIDRFFEESYETLKRIKDE